MARRTIDHSGRDVPHKLDGSGVEASQQETPAWHSIVGDGWEPVLIREPMCRGEEVLVAEGWVPDHSSGFLYEPGSLPRRRRKRFPVTITITGERDDKLFCQRLDVETGDRLEVGPDGSLVRVLNSLCNSKTGEHS